MELITTKNSGLQENKAKEIEKIYKPMVEMLQNMEDKFNEVVSQEITEELLPVAKRLRIDIAKVRTTADKARKLAKEESLRTGQAIDAAYKTLVYAVKSKEDKLKDIEEHYEKIEQQRIEELQIERANMVDLFIPLEEIPNNLGSMADDVFKNYLAGVEANYKIQMEAQKKAEEERIAKEKAEKEENERIRKENEKLKKEAEERERLAKIEAEKQAKIEAERKAKEEKERKAREEKERKEREEYEAKIRKERENKEKIEAELRAKKEAEEKAEQDRLAAIEAELSKGDSDKVKDLIQDLEALKTKYSFDSSENKKMYSNVNILLDKVITYIDK